MAALPGEREAALSEKVKFSRPSDPGTFNITVGVQLVARRSGAQLVAGPFATEAEARAALALLAMLAKGNA